MAESGGSAATRLAQLRHRQVVQPDQLDAARKRRELALEVGALEPIDPRAALNDGERARSREVP